MRVNTQSKLPYAFVIGLDCITGLQTARILAGHDIPIIALAKDPNHFCCQTRVCEKIIRANTAGEEFIEVLETLGPQLSQKAVLYPCTDMSVLTISRHRHRLAAWYHVVLPEPEVVEMLMDKVSFYTYAQEKGLPIPKTFLLKNRNDAEAAANELAFPCIMKPPMKTPTWEKHTRAKVYKVTNPEEFLALYDQCSGWAELLMVQEWIEGDDATLYSCNCYFNACSEPMVTFVARKLRQWPPQTGTSCLGEECRNDFVLEESIRLFRSVNYRGLGYVEMKRDERTGKHFIIEPNIGRPTGRSAIAEAGGVELLYTKYCDVLGLPLPANREQKYKGVKWIYLQHDIPSALHYWKRGELTLQEWWRSVRGAKRDAVFSWTDPAPFWYSLWKVARQLVNHK
ncbi:MAG: carboxylate--amine ligase [Chloroflexota bacterium]